MVTSEISKFEAKFLDFIRSNHSALLEKIRKEGKLDQSDETELSTILDSFIPESGLAMKAWYVKYIRITHVYLIYFIDSFS